MRKQLVDAILANPESDDALLVHADWLLGQSDPFGEEIQVRLELKRLGANHDDDLVESELDLPTLVRVHSLRQRLRQILAVKRIESAAEMNLLVKFGRLDTGHTFGAERESVAVRLLAASRMNDRDLQALATHARSKACLAELRELRLGVRDASNRMLARVFALMPKLEILRLEQESPLDALVTMPMPSLKELHVSGQLRDVGPLQRAPFAGQLERLALRGNPIGNEGVGAILTSGAFASLEHLGVASTGSTGDALAGGAPGPRRLRSLEIDFNVLRDEHMKTLVESPVFAALERLALHSAELGPDGLETLASSPAPLRNLHLGARVSAPALVRIVHAFALRRLSFEPAHGDADLAAAMHAFETAPHPSTLRSLKLPRAKIEDAAAASLARAGYLRNIRELMLHRNSIGDAGSTMLANADLPFLSEVGLTDNPIRRAGRDAWAARREAHPLLDGPRFDP